MADNKIKNLTTNLMRIMIILLLCFFAFPFAYVSLDFTALGGGALGKSAEVLGYSLGIGDALSGLGNSVGATIGKLIDDNIGIGFGVSLLNSMTAYNVKIQIAGRSLVETHYAIILILIPVVVLLFVWMNEGLIRAKARMIISVTLMVIYFALYCGVTVTAMNSIKDGSRGIGTLLSSAGLSNTAVGAVKVRMASGSIITYVLIVLIITVALVNYNMDKISKLSWSDARKMVAASVIAEPVRCSNCGNIIKGGASFCQSCGTKVEKQEVVAENNANEVTFCPECGASIEPGTSFCQECGARI